MAIRKDQGALRPQRAGGRSPDAHPRIGPTLAQAWHQQYLDEGREFMPIAAEGATWRHSWAGICARQFQYRVQNRSTLGNVLTDPASYTDEHRAPDPGDVRYINPIDLVELLKPEARDRIAAMVETDPPSIAGHWTFGLGQMVHEKLQEAIENRYETDAKSEVKVDVTSTTGGAGSIDMVLEVPAGEELRIHSDGDSIAVLDPHRIAVEIKTMNGFGFKRMIGDRGDPEGPRSTSVVQLALNAHAVDADEGVLVVVSMECLSPAVYRQMMGRLGGDADADNEWRRFVAEYTFTRAEYTPIAEAEHRRVKRILELDSQGLLVPRSIPDPAIPPGARISDPNTGRWEHKDSEDRIVDTGTTWHCAYCDNRSRCVSDGPS